MPVGASAAFGTILIAGFASDAPAAGAGSDVWAILIAGFASDAPDPNGDGGRSLIVCLTPGIRLEGDGAILIAGSDAAAFSTGAAERPAPSTEAGAAERPAPSTEAGAAAEVMPVSGTEADAGTASAAGAASTGGTAAPGTGGVMGLSLMVPLLRIFSGTSIGVSEVGSGMGVSF